MKRKRKRKKIEIDKNQILSLNNENIWIYFAKSQHLQLAVDQEYDIFNYSDLDPRSDEDIDLVISN